MKQYRRFLLLLAMQSAVTLGLSQTIIVKDSITNEPISFVSVCFGNEYGGYTDEEGAIAIPNEAAQISAHRNRPFCVTPSGRWGFFVQNKVRYFWKYRK